MRASWSPASLSEKWTIVVMLLFGSVFVALGVYAGYTEAVKALAEDDRRGLTLAILGGLAFTAFGALILLLAWGAGKVGSKQKAVRASRPDAPWMWKPEWESRRIDAHTRRAAIGSWFVALFITALSSPLLWKVPERAAEESNPLLYGFWVFPLAGLLLIVRAGYTTRRWRKFGSSHLELTSLPGLIGGRLQCLLHLGTSITSTQGMRFRLDCIRESQSGGNRGTQTRILWQQDTIVAHSSFMLGPHGTSVPFEATIPYECAPSDESDPSDRIIWQLSAHAALAGVDYRASFAVPVFKTALSSDQITLEIEELPRIEANRGMGSGLPGSKIRVGAYGLGGMEFYFGPARNPLAAGILSLVVVGLAALIPVLATRGTPSPVLVCVALMGALLTWGALALWLGATCVRVEDGRIHVRRGLFGMGPTHSYTRDRIRDIRVHNGTQWGNKLYYNIKIEIEAPPKGPLHANRPRVRKMPAGGAIPERREAAALAQAMKHAVGMEA